VEQVQALADLAMVAFFGFFDALDIGGQLLLVSPGRAVDPLQLFVLRSPTAHREAETAKAHRG